MIWKQDQMLEKSKLIEEQLQSSLKRKHLDCETLEAANKTLRGENSHMAKALCLQKQKHHIQRLEMILSQKESCLHAKSMELDAAHKETNRLVEEYNNLHIKYESLIHEYGQLQSRLRSLEQKIKITQKYSSGKANSSCAEFLKDDFIDLECGAINQDYTDTAYETEDAALYRQIEVPSKAGISKLWHTFSLPQNYSNDGVSLTGNGMRPEKGINLSTFGEDLQEEQLCLVNDQDTPVESMHPMLEVNAKQFQLCPPTRSSNTSFPKSGNTARKQWKISRQTSNLAESNACMGTKVESEDTIIAAQSNTSDAAHSSTSVELQKIQDEIKEREKSWKQIEASMRAELSRRRVQLHEVNIM